MSFYGTAGLLEKDVRFRLQTGEIISDMPLAWLRGEYGKGTFKIRRVRAKFRADEPLTEQDNGLKIHLSG